MRIGVLHLAACLAGALLGASAATADSATATCEVRRDGETKQGASGPCTFSQRQGHINLDLRNGDSFSLTPAGGSGHYRDQKGHNVVRTLLASGSEEFKWEGGRKIILTYASSSGESPPPASGSASSGTPPGLADLIGVRGSSGEAELNRRGYSWVRTEKSGGDSYTYWRENENGQCVVVRTSDGRYASIAYGMESSCSSSSAPAGVGGGAERQDAFDTVCGVMFDGNDHAYRCGATDFYSAGRKVRTELRYPDQTIQLTWHSGNRVGLQFEGMVPKEARYAASEGETNFVFEGKTYYYFSDKGRAQSEWQKLRD